MNKTNLLWKGMPIPHAPGGQECRCRAQRFMRECLYSADLVVPGRARGVVRSRVRRLSRLRSADDGAGEDRFPASLKMTTNHSFAMVR